MYNFNYVLTETSTKCWYKSPCAGMHFLLVGSPLRFGSGNVETLLYCI